MPKADSPIRITSVQPHTLTIAENSPSRTQYRSTDWAVPAPSPPPPLPPPPLTHTSPLRLHGSTNASVGKERNAIEGKEATVNNEHQAQEVEVVERERYDTGNRPTHLTPAANANINTNRSRECKDLDANDKNDDHPASKEIKT